MNEKMGKICLLDSFSSSHQNLALNNVRDCRLCFADHRAQSQAPRSGHVVAVPLRGKPKLTEEHCVLLAGPDCWIFNLMILT